MNQTLNQTLIQTLDQTLDLQTPSHDVGSQGGSDLIQTFATTAALRDPSVRTGWAQTFAATVSLVCGLEGIAYAAARVPPSKPVGGGGGDGVPGLGFPKPMRTSK